MTTLYQRQWRLEVGDRTTGISRTWDSLRMRWSVKKDGGSEPNRVSVEVHNLSPDSRGFLEVDSLRLVLRAGYGDASPPIVAVADIGEVTHERDGTEWITTLDGGDGEVAYRDAFVSASLQPGSTVDEAIRVVADVLGRAGVTIDEDRIRALPVVERLQGWAFEGAARDAADELLEGLGYDWSVQDGELRFVEVGGYDETVAVALKASTGLIGTPKRTKDGWEVTSLLQPTIRPGGRLRVDSAVVSGWMLVGDVTHSGDTHGSDWTTTAEVTPDA